MRISKRALAFFLTVIMIISMVPSTVFAVDNAAGTIARAYVREDGTRVVVDMVNVTFSESVELKLYSGDTLLTTAELDTDKVAPGSYGELTGAICMSGTSSWFCTEWTPLDDVVPTMVKLVVDGKVVDTYNKVCDSNATIEIYNQISAEKWATLGATLAIGGRIYRAYLNENKGRIYLDLLNLSYSKSVALELYSGDTLLTTVTLNADEYPGPANKNELTASICVANYKDSDTWLCKEWTPMDNMVPTEIKLVVDNQVVDTCTTILVSA